MKGPSTPLVALVRDGTEEQKRLATNVLAHLSSSNAAVRVEIVREGAIPPLTALVQTGTDAQKQSAANVLAHLASSNLAFKADIAKQGDRTARQSGSHWNRRTEDLGCSCSDEPRISKRCQPSGDSSPRSESPTDDARAFGYSGAEGLGVESHGQTVQHEGHQGEASSWHPQLLHLQVRDKK